jgi:hypothetical protein
MLTQMSVTAKLPVLTALLVAAGTVLAPSAHAYPYTAEQDAQYVSAVYLADGLFNGLGMNTKSSRDSRSATLTGT